MSKPKIHSRFTAPASIPEIGVIPGTVGVVIDHYGKPSEAILVEFADDHGVTYGFALYDYKEGWDGPPTFVASWSPDQPKR